MKPTLSFILLLLAGMILFFGCTANNNSATNGNAGSSGSSATNAGAAGNARDENGALKTSVSLKLTNATQEGANDVIVRTIFESQDTETSFGQEVVEASIMRNEFSDVRPYNDPESYYAIEMINYRIIEPRTLNRTLYTKAYIFQFVLRFRDFQAGTNTNGAPMGYVLTQAPITIRDIGSRSPIEVYTQALNTFIRATVSRGYYKSAEQIERENAAVPNQPDQ